MAVLICDHQEGQSLVNPYQQQQQKQQQQQSMSDMSIYHPFHVVRRVGIISACLYGLHRYQVYHLILHSPKIHHGWFKAGLASSIGNYYFTTTATETAAGTTQHVYSFPTILIHTPLCITPSTTPSITPSIIHQLSLP